MNKRLTIASTLTMSLLAGAQEVPQGLQFDQVESSGSAPVVQKEKMARTTPLSLPNLKQLLSRLAPLKPRAGDTTDFALRAASLPAPKAGKRIAQPFPPAQKMAPPTVERKPFEVLRHSPEGDVELAPQLSITFNQPMVELSSARTPNNVPVRLTPETPGEWRWVGTQTLVFQPKTRLPMATEYRAEVTDPRIQSPVTWTFRTPPPRLISRHPGGAPVDLRPVLFLQFDQRVDAEQIARLLVLEANGKRFPVRTATREEIALDDNVSALVKTAEAQRWTAVVPVAPLPAGTTFQAFLDPGVPSLEGPRKTTERLVFTFATYSPLQIDSKAREEQPPGSPLWISFNNPLDAQRFRPETVKVTPELPGMRAVVRGDNLWIHGRTQGRTTYTVVVPATLTDKYGQTLGKDTPVEFAIGSAEPTFVPPGKNFLVLDPSGPPQLTFTTVNYPSLDVKVHSVEPGDWKAYHEAFSHRWDGKAVNLPGKLVFEGRVDASAPPDQIREVKVDLARALEAGSNQLVLEVAPTGLDKDRRRYSTYYGWVQRSQIGANLVADGKQLLAWVNQLSDGKPLPEAEVRLLGTDQVQRTGPNGVATLEWKGDASAVLIRQGQDRLFFPANPGYWGGTFNPGSASDQTLWYVTDDRKLYKPGEIVSVKGWLRRQIHQHRGDLQATTDKTLRYRLLDSRGNEISKGQAAIGRLGGFDFKVALPKNFNLGHARVELQSDSASHSHSFEVQEFRRPEFEVSSETEGGSTVVGGRGAVSIEAKYYAGGGLPNAPVTWHVSSTPTNYSPPKWEEFTFGSWTPWWEGHRWWETPAAGTNSKTFQGRTDHAGKHRLELAFRSVNPPRPHSVQANGTVMDVNRQAWSSSTTMLVHPANQYVGIKARSTFVEAGKPLDYQFIVTDLDGRAISGKVIQVKAYRVSWEYADEDYRSVRKEVFAQTLTSGGAPVSLAIPTTEGGTYQIEATIQDEANRSNQSQMTSWVAGGKQPPNRNVETQQITLIPNKRSYDPGDVAEILVQSPFGDAQGLVTLERHGVVERQMLDLSRGHATLKVPLEEGFVPNLHVHVDAVGKQPRVDPEGNPVPGAPPQPAQGAGSLNLEISARSRQLQVDVKPQQAKAQPGSQNALDVVIRDAAGKPVSNSEIALFVVDESVLALVGGDYADPWKLFYSLRSADTGHHGMRQYVELALPQEIEAAGRDEREGMPMPAPSMAVGAVANEPMEMAARDDASPRAQSANRMRRPAPASPPPPPPPIKVRTNFSALAFYVPGATSDAEGRVRLPFKLPDNLTRYRVVALAVAGEKQFGKGQSSLVAQQPLMVRPSPPRFLNFGDRCELPVVVQNGTDKPMDVQLACRTTNLKLDPKQAGVSLQVPANDRVEVRFPVSADQAGTARFQVAASSGPYADAAELDLPVWTPATTEAFATYGVLDAGAAVQAVAPPGDVFKQFGGLEVSTSSTALQELTDAFIYLRNYPYECTEQISSRVLSAVALLPVLQAFDAPGLPDKTELKASMEKDIKRLQGQQNHDGGWDFWERDRPSVPYVSLHCTHALMRLRKGGYKVPDRTYDQALSYVNSIEQRIPADYPDYVKRTLRAYAVYLLRLNGQPNVAKARQLIQEWGSVEKTPFESLGWLLPTLSGDPVAVQIRKHLNNRATETASTAQFTSTYNEEAEHLLLASSRRDDAILLEALIEDQPRLDLIPKLVRGLLDGRVQGRWANTQENCWVLLALQQYFSKYENVTPDFVARIWLGDKFAGQQSFKGRSADTKDLHVPMRLLDGKQDLVVSKDGPGRLYYRLGMKYAPTNLKLAPMERGFSVERKYEAVDDNRDVRREGDGSWHIRSGSKVKVTVTMAAPARRYHVALVDPLPAGLEAINPALQGSEPTPTPRGRGLQARGGRHWWWNPRWYEHQNLRDERVEAFSQMVWEGVYDYSYYARATTPGNFVVPPAKAEEMYQPETFGRSSSDRVVIDP